ncbi:MAG: DUF2127 domain-containing protein [Bryobacteraceae bacterium]
MAKARTRRRHPPPQAIDPKHTAGLRTIAVVEAAKGLLVVLVELGLLSLIHKDVAAVAERVVHRLHMNPEHRVSHVILEAAYRMTDAKLWALAAGAAAYSTVRFVEAYGLWNKRVWAEWFALLSGCLYLPWEIYEVVDHPTIIHFAVFSANVIIVLYMLMIRLDAYRHGES